jgi:hypothetical protein
MFLFQVFHVTLNYIKLFAEVKVISEKLKKYLWQTDYLIQLAA